MPAPLIPKSTVFPPTTSLEAVAVTIIIVPSCSVPILGLTERLTSGKSLSVIVIFCVVVAPKAIPAVGLLIVKVAVSLPSISASSRIVKVAVPVVAPFKMVIVVALKL